MKLEGKKINFLGDSITYGVGTSCENKNFVSVFEKISGSITRNYGISGTRIAPQRVKSQEESFDMYFAGRVSKMNPDADVVVVFGGTNDYGHGDAPLGNFSDRNEKTFYGAMHHLCRTLLETFPTSVIVFLTPLHRLGENNYLNENGIRNQAPLYRYVEIIKEVTRYYALPTLDLYSVSGIQPEVEVVRKLYMPDGLHPNDKGAELIAKRLYGYLKSL